MVQGRGVVEKTRGSEEPAPCENLPRRSGMGTRAGQIEALLFSVALRRAVKWREAGLATEFIEQKSQEEKIEDRLEGEILEYFRAR